MDRTVMASAVRAGLGPRGTAGKAGPARRVTAAGRADGLG